MNMEAKLTEMVKSAMKSGEKNRLMGLRAIKAALTNERTRHSGDLSEDASMKVISAHRKKMDNAIAAYADAKRDDLVNQAKLEVAICDDLLPARLTEDDIIVMIDEAIAATGASSPADMGKVMGPVMKQVAGRADGNTIRNLLMKKLGG